MVEGLDGSIPSIWGLIVGLLFVGVIRAFGSYTDSAIEPRETLPENFRYGFSLLTAAGGGVYGASMHDRIHASDDRSLHISAGDEQPQTTSFRHRLTTSSEMICCCNWLPLLRIPE